MSDLHMIQLDLDGRALGRWAAARRLGDDLGYSCHAALCDAYGDLRPKPFTARELPGGRIKLLGYAPHDADAMREVREACSEPEAANLFRGEVSKRMPTDWAAGRRFRFELRVALTRQGRTDEGRRTEGDAIRFAPPGSDREEVYREWLVHRVTGDGQAPPAAELIEARIVRYSTLRASRRAQVGEGRRPAVAVSLPDVTFEGLLSVGDPAAFARLLATGVGRHRAFGFGALMLLPPKG